MSYTTRPSLLKRLNDGSEIAWEEFYAFYAPYIRRIGSALRLEPSETDDLIQQTMLSLFTQGSVMKYDPAHGKFRSYLKTIVTCKAMDIFRKKKYEEEFSEAHEQAVDQFERVYQAESREFLRTLLMEELKEIVSPQNFQIFQYTERMGYTPAEAAECFEVPVSRVYTIRKRCLEHLREIAKAYSDLTGDLL